MCRIALLVTLLSFTIPVARVSSQDAPKWYTFSGYFHDLQQVTSLPGQGSNIMLDNTLHNRLNLAGYPVSWLSLYAQVRNRFIIGESVKLVQNYGALVKEPALSWNWLDDTAFVANTTIDRLYAQLQMGTLQIAVGRQRINWGQTFVWNPNDLFNTYSFFEVDYAERQGSDAARLSWYPTETSQLDVAGKINADGLATIAGNYRFNARSTDFQVIAGVVDEHDYALGGGWATQVKGAGVRGEATWFYPVQHTSDTLGIVLFCLAADYRMTDKLYLQAEVLYNSTPADVLPENFQDVYNEPQNAKNLSLAQWNLFGQLSWTVTPLLNTSLAGMYLPDVAGFFIGPALTYSLSDNASASFYWQSFSGKFESPIGEKLRDWAHLAFIKVGISF